MYLLLLDGEGHEDVNDLRSDVGVCQELPDMSRVTKELFQLGEGVGLTWKTYTK